MTELEQVASAGPEIIVRRRNRFLQWNIATLLLLMAAVGVWTSYFLTKSETERMDAELVSLRQLARELVVDDPSQFAIVQRYAEWHDDHAWDIYLPEGSGYLVKLATREINKSSFPTTEHSAELAGGQHVISLEWPQRGAARSARVIVDGKPVITLSESNDWVPRGGSEWGGNYNRSTQAPTDKPLELFRFRFHQPATRGTNAPDEPYNGLFLWIERKE